MNMNIGALWFNYHYDYDYYY